MSARYSDIPLVLACVLAPFALAACTTSALRVFEKKVPAPIVKPAAQVEAERATADLIAREILTPVELKVPAQKLSESLGQPEKPIRFDSITESANLAIARLNTSLLLAQREHADLNKTLATYQGKTIEGTGFSLLGPGIFTIVIILAVLGVIFPPIFTLLAFAYRRMKATASLVVNQIEAASEEPEAQAAIKSIKTTLNNQMDSAQKKIIHALQAP